MTLAGLGRIGAASGGDLDDLSFLTLYSYSEEEIKHSFIAGGVAGVAAGHAIAGGAGVAAGAGAGGRGGGGAGATPETTRGLFEQIYHFKVDTI